jgi:hypothetical protein
MSDLKQKFVITREIEFIMGRVVFHKHLSENAMCGGYWFFDKEKDITYLYSTSYDFGGCSAEMIEKLKPEISEKFRGAEVKFEADENIELYDILFRDMSEERAMELISNNDWV